jgi:hypothetical protein
VNAKTPKLCEGADRGKCKRFAPRKDRFCPACASVMLTRMRASGYLVPVPGDWDGDFNVRPIEPEVGEVVGLSAAGPWDGDDEP